ncbi:thioredoxin domain-containing protein [Nocardiopsis valliformis]|uniref:thioredoxin domain-containing protein n=1 Tax=Nocardiopsis valliformis TaxID=239974 RepID=UPI00034D5026|nr:thioredoxin domain-containing protein [Nocardiopsis valliformis]
MPKDARSARSDGGAKSAKATKGKGSGGPAKPKDARRGGVSPLLIGGAVVVALVVAVVVGLRLEGGDPDGESPDAASVVDHIDAEQREWGQALARRTADDPMALGSADAPVVLVAYSDFACPYCATWAQETQPELVKRYVDSGDLRIEWREFPYLGELSQTLSVGAVAAGEQDAFWEYQEAVFDRQDELKSASDPDGVLDEIVEELGLDSERFQEDLGAERSGISVGHDFVEGQQIGVSATPAFVINGDPVMGAQPLDVFVRSVDTALAAAGE